jgi:hypothetical protein
MSKQTWKLKDKDRPGENSCPRHFAEKNLTDRKIQNQAFILFQWKREINIKDWSFSYELVMMSTPCAIHTFSSLTLVTTRPTYT